MAVGIQELGLYISIIVSSLLVCHAFAPVDNYLIDCGSLSSTTISGRTFVADSSLSSTMTTARDILANTELNPNSSSGMSAIYRTTRIFTGPSSYTFPIKVLGRHFIPLHFFPFVYGDYHLTTATFSVSTQDAVLLNNFKPPVSASMKEYLLKITSDNLILSIVPLESSSFAFVNGIEVISVVDDRLAESPQTVRQTAWGDLLGQALETVYWLNVGGQDVPPDSDAFGRTWETDAKFLLNGSRSKTSFFSGQIYFQPGGPSNLTALETVYAMVRELDPSNISDPLINMTWKFNVDANFSYFMRFHFCDIVRSSLSPGVIFDVSIGGWPILKYFKPSFGAYGRLARALFLEFVLDANDASNQIFIVISPSSINANRDRILNGLQIMKMNFSTGSVFVVTPSGSEKNIGIILGIGIAVRYIHHCIESGLQVKKLDKKLERTM